MKAITRFRAAAVSVALMVAIATVVVIDGVTYPQSALALPFAESTDDPNPGPPSPPGADTAYTPADVPPDPSAGELPDLEPGGDVEGGGPGAATIQKYLPTFRDPSIVEGDGSTATRWIQLGLKVADPPVARMFSVLSAVNGCGQSSGMYAVRGYRKRGAIWAGGIVMISKNALQHPASYLAQCIGPNGDVSGGGPGDLVCNTHYAITTPDDVYYVIIAGLPGEVCPAVASAHLQFPHTAWP